VCHNKRSCFKFCLNSIKNQTVITSTRLLTRSFAARGKENVQRRGIFLNMNGKTMSMRWRWTCAGLFRLAGIISGCRVNPISKEGITESDHLRFFNQALKKKANRLESVSL